MKNNIGSFIFISEYTCMLKPWVVDYAAYERRRIKKQEEKSMNKKFFRISMAVGASVVIATALFVNASVTNPPASGKKQAVTTTGSADVSDAKASESTQLASATALQAEQAFTLKQLSSYNGQNGQPAYVAYKGTVYDLTAVGNWSSGKHHGISAGTDVTAAFASSPHAASILKMGIVMGKLVSETASTTSAALVAPSPGPASTSPASRSSTTMTAAVSGPALKVYTLAQLAKYNALGGNPAYVAYKGIVYDLSAVGTWSSGKHHGVTAGTDVTALFASSPHAVSILDLGFVVGTMEGFTGTLPVRAAPAQSGATSVSGSDDDEDHESDDEGFDDKDHESDDEGYDDKDHESDNEGYDD
jgi:predicted heme/steroid binding protein